MGSSSNYSKANQCIVNPCQGRFGLGSQYFQGWPVPLCCRCSPTNNAGISTGGFNNSTARRETSLAEDSDESSSKKQRKELNLKRIDLQTP
jgi:hypothetical protein